MTTQFASGNGAALPEGKPDPVDTYMDAVWALKQAAHAVSKASHDTTALPLIDRQSLRLIRAEADRLFAQGDRSGAPGNESTITYARLDQRI
jgi:hypothetical protein